MPRPWPRWTAALGLAVLLAAALLPALPGTAAGQAPAGWKRPGTRPGAPPPTNAEDQALTSGGFYSNLGLLESITRDAVESVVDSLRLPQGAAVTLYASVAHEANWFVGEILAGALADRGYRVRIAEWADEVAADETPAAPGGAGAPRPGQPRPGNGQAPRPGAPPAVPPTGTPADTTGAHADSVAAADPLWGGDDPEEQAGGASVATPDVPPEAPAAEASEPGAEESAFATAAPLEPGAIPAGNALDLRVIEFGVNYSSVGRKFFVGPVRFTRIGGVYIQLTSQKGPEGELRQLISAERHQVDRLSGSQRALAEGASYPFQAPELKSPSLGRYIEPAVVVAIVGSLVYLFSANQN